MQLDNLNTILWIGFLLLCVLPLLIVAVVGFLLFRAGRRRLEDFTSPDISKLRGEFEKLRLQNPNASTEQLVGKIIHRQALKCGVIGALTGWGGFFTLPIALPVDIILSLRLQAALVNFIAAIYGHDQGDDTEAKVRTYLIMSAGGEVSERTTEVAMKFLLRVIGESFSKLVPLFSAAISFGVDYGITQAIGRVAVRRYGRP